MSLRDELEHYAEESEARPDELRFLTQRISVDAARARTEKPAWFPWRGLATLAAVFIAFFIGVVVSPDGSNPAPTEAVALAPTTDAPAEVSPATGVNLRYAGLGSIHTVGKVQHLSWEDGNVEAQVQAGSTLVVQTEEGSLTAENATFKVTRDVLGTAVQVVQGALDLKCQDGSEQTVGVAQEGWCLPTTPGGLLGRAVQLRQMSADGDAVLDTLNRGLVLASGGPIASELVVFKISTLVTLGHDGDALALAEAYLAAEPTHRRIELLRLAARVGYRVDECRGAKPHLQALYKEKSANADDKKLGTQCGM
jgi:hypothetical protein